MLDKKYYQVEKKHKSAHHVGCPTPEDLHLAIRFNDIQRVKKIVTADKVDINTVLRSSTALSIAVYARQERIVTLLLEFGANVDSVSVDKFGRTETPLFTACRLGHLGIVEQLLARGASVNIPDFYRHSPLWISTREKRMEIVQKLIDHGARLNIAQVWSQCPLYLAAKYSGRAIIGQALIYHGCDITIVDEQGRNALYWAIEHSDSRLVAALLDAGAELLPRRCRRSLPDTLEISDVHSMALLSLPTPPPLTVLSRTAIRRALITHSGGASVVKLVDRLPLPTRLTHFVKLEFLKPI